MSRDDLNFRLKRMMTHRINRNGASRKQDYAMKRLFARAALAAMFAATAMLASPASAQGTSLRCGWFESPSPGIAWLHDRDGEWIVSSQSGNHSDGPWPRFARTQWVQTGSGNAGYGCACLRAEADDFSMEITQIHSAYARPLSACRSNSMLREPERAPR